ncbi:MAG: hypothetical protein R3D60_07870 [Paracoccaceae bacterium]
MVIIASVVLGAILGFFQSRKRGGSGFDKAQWSAVFAMIGGILGMAVTVMIDRMT